MNLETDVVRLFAEIGFLGISRGELAAAADIFETLAILRPTEEVGAVGLALAALGMGRIVQAQQILAKAPQTETVVAFSVMAHGMAGDRRQAEALLDDLTAMRAAPELIAMASAALDDAHGQQPIKGQVG
ncbi:hypothetical protein [Phaeobacter sp. HF9A]|uniref:hypothetical protein n=1 Tax=Phaeobacter sp. HF9A TaxID=2721561 RepID=UPI00142FE466|nr:hypothetical protein [Phaeobacter sp. HF9A]NIZ12012.1 hypothetical protein [Phaeobacter sp. HF9A]